MATLGTLEVALTATTAELTKNLKNAQTKLEGFKDTAEKVGKAASVAFAGVSFAAVKMVQASDEQARAEVRLQQAIKSTGNEIDAGKIFEYASALQGLTNVGDEVTIAQAATLASMGLTEDQIVSMLPLIQDMAAGGKSLESATMAAGKAILGQVDGLKEFGINISKNEASLFQYADAAERAAFVQQRLTESVGGAAKALKDAGVGSIDQMTGALGDMFEQMGDLIKADFAGVMDTLTDSFNRVGAALKGVSPQAKRAFSNIIVAAGALTGMTAAMAGAVLVGPKVIAGFMGMGKAIQFMGKSALVLGKSLLKVLAIATPVAAALGAVSLAQQFFGGTAQEKAALKQRIGVGEDAGVGEIIAKVGVAAVKEGFAPITDAMSDGAAALMGFFDGAQDVGDSASDLAAQMAATQRRVARSLGPTGKLEDVVKPPPKAAQAKEAKEALKEAVKETSAPLPATGLAAASPEFQAQAAELSANMDLANGAIDQAAQSIAGAMGPKTSAIAQGIAQGFSTGGPFGALFGGIIAIVSQMQSFGRIMAIVEDTVGRTIDRLDPILAVFVQLFEAVSPLALLLFDLSTTFGMMNTTISFLNFVVGGVAKAVAKVTEGIASIFNKVIDKLADLASFIPGAAKKIRKAKIDIEDFGPELDSGTFDDAHAAIAGMAGAATDAAGAFGQLSNVPSGFKVALERFQAVVPGVGSGGAGVASAMTLTGGVAAFGAGRDRGRSTITVENLYLGADDPDELAQQLADEADWEDGVMEDQDAAQSAIGATLVRPRRRRTPPLTASGAARGSSRRSGRGGS
jgi:hypothetical protein